MRSGALDLFKTLLVVGMVTIHVYQLLGMMLPGWVERVSEGINLVTFSGFLLAMGIGVGMGSERVRGWGERLRPVLMLLLATWLSSFGFMLLVERAPLTAELALEVISLRRLLGWSEFLASFFMLYLVLAVARPLVVRMAMEPLAFGLSLALAFVSTWVVVNGGIPAAATLVGTTDFASFPLLPYLPWFLVGIRIGRDGGRVGWGCWAVAAVCSGIFVFDLWRTGALPGRFPPTILWVIGPALPLLVYWSVARGGAGALGRFEALTLPGRHVLSFLLVSNLAIFIALNLWGKPVRDVGMWLGGSGLLLVAIGLGWWLVEAVWRPRALEAKAG